MRGFTVLSCLLWGGMAHAADMHQIESMLAAAVGAQGPAYLEARKAIVELGEPAKPILLQAATSGELNWQQRLVARISYERVVRGDETDALRRYVWPDHPQYDKGWEAVITGPASQVGRIAVPEFVKTGLWYYYLEVCWKKTGEGAIAPFDPRVNTTLLGRTRWERWCMGALRTQPERYYLLQYLQEQLTNDPELKEPDSSTSYAWLFENAEVFAMPVILERFDSFFGKEASVITDERSRARYLWNKVHRICGFALAEQADLLDEFCRKQTFLNEYQDKLAPLLREVRSRPHKEVLTEPPFYLATPAQPPP